MKKQAVKDQTGTNRRRVRKHQMCKCFENRIKEIEKIENRIHFEDPIFTVSYPYIYMRNRNYFVPFQVLRYGGEKKIIAEEMLFCPFCGERIISRDDE